MSIRESIQPEPRLPRLGRLWRQGVAALARMTTRGSTLVPAALLVFVSLGSGGVMVLPEVPEPAEVQVERTTPIVLSVDQILAQKLPGLGLGLRRRLATTLVQEAEAVGLEPTLVLGLIEVESEFKGQAVSSAGARGLMQLMPGTAEFLAEMEGFRLTAEEIYRDPEIQVLLGIRYLGKLQKRFGSLERALMAYNAGPERLQYVLNVGESTSRYYAYAKAVERQKFRYHRDMMSLGGQVTEAK